MAQDDIQGQVVDAQGNPVDGAIVELTKSYQSSPTGQEAVQRTTTDSNGNYIFEGHPDGDGTTQEWHVSCYNHDGTAYVNSFNNPGVTADLPTAIPDSVTSRPADDGSANVDKRRGLEIQPQAEFGQIGARISTMTSGVSTAYAVDLSDDSIVDQIDISGLSSGDAFVLTGPFSANQNYGFVLDNGGSSYTNGFANGSTGLVSGDDVDIIGGLAGAQTGQVHQTVNDIGDVGF